MKQLFFLISFLFFVACSEGKKKIQVYQIPKPPPPPPALDVSPDPDFMSLAIAEDQMLKDATSLPDALRERTRWLLTCNFRNEGKRNYKDFEDGVNTGINLVSSELALEKAATIGVGNCIHRIDLGSYGITAMEWRRIEKNLLLKIDIQSLRGQNLAFLVQSEKPYAFAADFFTTVLGADKLTFENGIYYDLIEQPADKYKFFESLGCDPQRGYDEEETSLQGFSESGIALQKTRSVEVQECDVSEYLVTTYDSSLQDQRSHFVTPFTKEAANAQGVFRSDKIFIEAAQEHIYFLKNDMLGFRLNGGGIGHAELFAPNDVVLNLNATSKGLDPTIYIGSCSQCHNVANPMLAFTDQLRSHILGQAAFDAFEKELASVFMNPSKMAAKLSRITQRYQTALEDLDVSLSSVDPLGENIISPFRGEMNAKQISGYLLMPENVFLDRLSGSSVSAQIFGSLLNGGRVGLGIFSANFEQLVLDVGAYKDETL